MSFLQTNLQALRRFSSPHKLFAHKTMLPHTAVKALAAMHETNASDRLKTIEALSSSQQSVDAADGFVVRVDGVAFRTFTKGLDLFDERLTDAMLRTAADLVVRFNPTLAYTQSDEISLVFPSVNSSEKSTRESTGEASIESIREATATINNNSSDKNLNSSVHIYNGRISKITTILSSYAAARFNFHLANPPSKWDSKPDAIRTRMTSHQACFDARAIITNDNQTLMECIYWRSNFDGIRNAVSKIAHAHFTTSQLHRKSVIQQTRMLNDKGINITQTYSTRTLFGTWIKKELFEIHNAVDGRTGLVLPHPVIRTRIRFGSFNWADWSVHDRIQFTINKHWPSDPSAPPMDPLQI